MSDFIIRKAIKKAEQSISTSKISAIGISKNGNIIAMATNRPRFDRYGGGVHAEMELLRRCGNRISTIIICRVGRSGEIRPIDPCPRCKKVLDKMGIKIVTIKAE